jgi:hypothetical protein
VTFVQFIIICFLKDDFTNRKFWHSLSSIPCRLVPFNVIIMGTERFTQCKAPSLVYILYPLVEVTVNNSEGFSPLLPRIRPQ